MSLVRGQCPLCGQWVEMSAWLEQGIHDVWRFNVHGMFAGDMEPPCPGSMLTAADAAHLARLTPAPSTARPIRLPPSPLKHPKGTTMATSESDSTQDDKTRIWLLVCETTDRGEVGTRNHTVGAYLSEHAATRRAKILNDDFKDRWKRHPRGMTEDYRVEAVEVQS